MVSWCLTAAKECTEVDEIIISTDDEKIKELVSSLEIPNCSIHHRSEENAQDHSSTESVMLEYLESAALAQEDIFILMQATSPFTKARNLTEALSLFNESKADSLLSATRSKRFFWNDNGTALNYDFKARPRRQEYDGLLMENGAFYISRVGDIIQNSNRLSGKIALYEMPEYTSLELDEPHDWIIAEQLMKKYS